MDWFDFREQVNAWSHCSGMILAVPATAILCYRARGNLAKQVSLLIFGIGLFACYAGSTLYHGVQAPEDMLEGIYARLDFIGIYLLIAGTITPVAFNLLEGGWRWFTLILAWSLAVAGITLRIVPSVELPTTASNLLYLGMGWGGLLCYFELARMLSHKSLLPAVLGGLSYSGGAILNWVHWPVLWQGVFSTHEFFHFLVLLGSVLHFLFLLNVVVPYQRPAEMPVEELPSELLPAPASPQ